MNSNQENILTATEDCTERSPRHFERLVSLLAPEYYRDGSRAIFNADAVHVLPRLQANSVDLTVTSPPFDKLRTYKGHKFEFEPLANELYRITKQGGIVVWQVGDEVVNGSETLTSFKQVIYFKEQCGFNVHDTMIYRKRNFSHPEKTRYHQVFEYVFILSKGKPKTFNPLMDRKNKTAGCIGNLGVNTFTLRDGSKSERTKKLTTEFGMRHNVWEGNTRGQEEMCKELKHPALMPKWLAEDMIRSWSNEGDIVLDPLCGQGTTLNAAKRFNRLSIGVEIAEEYCTLAMQEMSK
jgi:site-specific DNA-methyltransferase (adenine-specific)